MGIISSHCTPSSRQRRLGLCLWQTPGLPPGGPGSNLITASGSSTNALRVLVGEGRGGKGERWRQKEETAAARSEGLDRGHFKQGAPMGPGAPPRGRAGGGGTRHSKHFHGDVGRITEENDIPWYHPVDLTVYVVCAEEALLGWAPQDGALGRGTWGTGPVRQQAVKSVFDIMRGS